MLDLREVEEALKQAYLSAEQAKQNKDEVEGLVKDSMPAWKLALDTLKTANAGLKACRTAFEGIINDIYRNTGNIPASYIMPKPSIRRVTTITNPEKVIEELIKEHGIHAGKYLTINRQALSDEMILAHEGELDTTEDIVGDISWSLMK